MYTLYIYIDVHASLHVFGRKVHSCWLQHLNQLDEERHSSWGDRTPVRSMGPGRDGWPQVFTLALNVSVLVGESPSTKVLKLATWRVLSLFWSIQSSGDSIRLYDVLVFCLEAYMGDGSKLGRQTSQVVAPRFFESTISGLPKLV